MTLLLRCALCLVLMSACSVISVTVSPTTPIVIPAYCTGSNKFYCHLSDQCLASNVKCDGTKQCEQNEDEANCLPCTEETAAEQNNFFCKSTNSCISADWKCDGTPDCDGGEDEEQCAESSGCRADQWSCGDGQCILAEWQCDTQIDCLNGADEKNCDATCATNQFACGGTSLECISAQWHCDGDVDCANGNDEVNCATVECPEDRFNCSAEDKCMPNTWKCDGDTDCLSGEDEAHCTGTTPAPTNTRLCTALEFKCVSGSTQCIIGAWRCDGEADCDDGSDEKHCNSELQCTDAEFKCADEERCIPRFLTCSGKSECKDGSDEKLPSCPTADKKVCDLTKGEFKCDTTEYKTACITFDKVCDDHADCVGGLDEDDRYCGENAVTDYCDPAAHKCGTNPLVTCTNVRTNLESNHNITIGHTCHCPPGYEHVNNDCIDLDECAGDENPVCDQICTNEPGKYRCSCNEGYYLDQDNKTCVVDHAVHPKLLFSNRHAIRSIHIHGQGEYMPLLDSKDAVALDFDYSRQEIFYSDVTEKKLYKFKLPTEDMEDDPQQEELHINGLENPDRLAYDWIYKNLYWTDTTHNTINMASVDGEKDADGSRNARILYQNANPSCVNATKAQIGNKVCIDEPRALVVHPRKGWAFWSDWGSKPHIVLAALDGSSKEMIAYNTDSQRQFLVWPNGLTLDLSSESERLYWIDAKLHSLFSCTINRCITDMNLLAYSETNIVHPFSITVFENKLYWTDWNRKHIVSANKYTGENITKILDNLEQPMDLKVYHPMSQQSSTNHCEVEEGQEPLCQQICVPKAWTKKGQDSVYSPVPVGLPKYTCMCSDGYMLNIDHRTCTRKPQPVHVTSKPFVAATKPHTSTEGSGTSVGIIAAIASTVVLLVALAAGVIVFIVHRRIKLKKSKAMNFDNPIYKRTTEDKLELPRHEYQPSNTDPAAAVPLTSTEASSSSQQYDV